MKVVMLLFKDIIYDARVKREALTLAENGHEIRLFCLKQFECSFEDLHENIKIERISLRTTRVKRDSISNDSTIKKSSFLKLQRSVLKLWKDFKSNNEYYNTIINSLIQDEFIPNVIHCHDLNTLPIGVILNRKLNSKLIYDSHELFNEMASKNKIERKIGYLVEGMCMNKVDFLITVNELVKQEFNKRYGKIHTTVVQNIPINHLQDSVVLEGIPNIRKQYNIKDTDILLLYQGGLTPERGLEKCINVLTELPDHYKLILIGDGRIKENLKKLVVDMSLQKRVYFHNQVPSDQLLFLTKQADIGLVMYENTCKNNYLSTPNKIYEYMIAGIPTVASNHPGKSFIVNDVKTGVCVEETISGIKEGILKIIENYQYYKDNCEKNSDKYSWENEQQKLLTLYDIIGERK